LAAFGTREPQPTTSYEPIVGGTKAWTTNGEEETNSEAG